MFRNRRRLLIASTASILLVLAAVATYLRSHKNVPAHRFTLGERIVYRLEYTSASAADLGLLSGGGPKNEQTIFANVETDLSATVVEVSGERALIAYRFRKPEVQVVCDGDLALLQAEMIATDLGRTLLATVDRQGRIISVQLDPEVRSLSDAFIRTLLAETQIVLPRESRQTDWQSREEDPNGAYLARYAEDAAVLTKTKIEYLPRALSHAVRSLKAVSTATPSGQMTVQFDVAAGCVRSIDGTTATSIIVDEKVVARTEITLKMQLTSREMLTASDRDEAMRRTNTLKKSPAIVLSAPSATNDEAIHRNELGDATAEKLLADLAALETRPDGEETPLYLKLKALVYLQPDACPMLAKVLAAAKTDSRSMAILTEALSSIGHPAAQAALCDVIIARRDDEVALAGLIPALAMVERPTQASESLLVELGKNTLSAIVRESVELGLGTMARQMLDSQPARSDRIVATMLARLAAATSVEERRLVLSVLGNVGADKTLPAVAACLRDAAPEVRAAAASALRFIELAEADRLLTDTLVNDTDANIRVEAATALGFRVMTAETFAAQKKAFLADASTRVRLALLPNFARGASAFPECRTLLTQAAKDDCKEVRDEAANFLTAN
jgi:hypothetical protein